MATLDQTENAFQKQGKVVVHAGQGKKTPASGKKGSRYVKNIGLSFKVPKTAVEGKYVDKKCPFTGDVTIRGRIIKGLIISTKMKRTIIVRRDYLQYVKKYRRFEKRHHNVPAHISPAFAVKEGDIATIGQCRYVFVLPCGQRWNMHARCLGYCLIASGERERAVCVVVVPCLRVHAGRDGNGRPDAGRELVAETRS